MARIPYYDWSQAPEKLKAYYDSLAPLNLFRMMGHADLLMPALFKLGGLILGRTRLDAVLREIAIIRVGVLSRSVYEVDQHDRIGRKLGMTQALLDAIREGPEAGAFTPLQRDVMRFTDDVVAHVRASDATFEPLRRQLSLREVQELLVTISFYMMICRLLCTLDVELEAPRDDPSLDLDSLKPKR